MEELQIVLFGGGGGAVEIARYIRAMNNDASTPVKAVVSDMIDEGVGRIEDLQCVVGRPVGNHADTSTITDLHKKQFVITLGHLPLREQKFEMLKAAGMKAFTVIHPTALVSETASVGDGCVIAPLSMVGEFATLEENVNLNVHVTIGHDVSIGRSSILSPHASVAGGTQCGHSVYMGSGVIVNPGLAIGQFVKLSSGALVTKDVPAGSFAYGNPLTARKLFNPETGRSLFGG